MSKRHIESVGPFLGTTLVGSVYKHGKRSKGGVVREIPFSFIRADSLEGLLAIEKKYGIGFVLDRYNYGATLKEQAAVTPTGDSEATERRQAVLTWIESGADGAEKRTPTEYAQFLAILKTLGSKALNAALDQVFKDEDLTIE